MSRPATRNENRGTIKGPGAMASPAFRADHPHASCSHSTIDSNMAPNDAENVAATSEAPEKVRTRNSPGSMSGLSARAQCQTKRPTSTAARVSIRPT